MNRRGADIRSVHQPTILLHLPSAFRAGRDVTLSLAQRVRTWTIHSLPTVDARRHESVKLLFINMLIEWTSHILDPHTIQLRIPEGFCFLPLLRRHQIVRNLL